MTRLSKILGIWFAFHFITRILYQFTSRYFLTSNSSAAIQWGSACIYLVSTTLLLFVFFRWQKQDAPSVFPAFNFLRSRLFYASLVSFLGWMVAYLFLIRYQPSQWAVLTVEQSVAYSKIHFPDGLLSEFQEEVSYRGLLFGLLLPLLGAARANLLQATIFLLLHYIGVKHGHMDLMRSASTFLLALIFCGFRISSSSLVIPAAFHIFWNLISTFMFLSIEQGWRP